MPQWPSVSARYWPRRISGAACGIGLVAAAGKEEVPADHQRPDIEREGELRGVRRRGVDRLHRQHEIGVERRHVVVVDTREGRVGHRRVEVGPVGKHPVADGPAEIVEAVGADAVEPGRRDVGRHDRPHRRGDRVAAGEGGGARRGVAAGAVAGAGEVGAALDQGRVRRLRHGGRPAGKEDDGGEGTEESPDHRLRPRGRWYRRGGSPAPRR